MKPLLSSLSDTLRMLGGIGVLAGSLSLGFGQGTVALSPTADAYVRDGRSAAVNFGTSTSLEVQGGKTGQTADAYLKFDLAGASGIGAARLRVYARVGNGAATVRVRAHAVSGTSWVEPSIVWGNRPALGQVLAETIVASNVWGWVEFDVTGYVRAEKAAGRNVICLGLHTTNSLSKYVVARAREASTNSPQLVIVSANKPPSVGLTAPAQGAVFTAPSNITLSASAADPDGTVSKVEFFADSAKIGEDTTSPYTVDWSGAAPGPHELSARATDNLGAVTVSPPVGIQVLDGDTDYDGLSNWREVQAGTDPFDAGSYTPVRLAYFRFNSPTLEGEAGQLPRWWTDAPRVPSWSGSALEFVQPSAVVRYNDVEADWSANINCRQGAVRLWFKPNWSSDVEGGTGPQNWCRLVQVGRYSDPATIGDWSFGFQPDGNFLHFTAQTNGAHASYVMGPIRLRANTWHQIVLVYSPIQTAVYVDGVQPPLFVDNIPTGRGQGVTVYPGPEARAQYGVYFGTGNGDAPCRGQLDEIETFNYPLTPQQVIAGFPNFDRADAVLDSDYDGRSDLLETLVDGTDPNDAQSVQAVRLGYWRFDTVSFLGEQGQAPIAASAAVAPSWSGQALRVDAVAGAGLVYRDVETHGLANVNCQRGSVRFWVKPNWTSGLGPAAGRLVEVGGNWHLDVTDAGTRISFWCNQDGSPSPQVSTDINWTAGQWHQVVLAYDMLGTRLYVDGELAPGSPGLGVTAYPGAAERTNSFAVGFSKDGTSQINGQIEELETFNHVLSASEITTHFLFYKDMDLDLNGVADTVEDPALAQAEPFTQVPFVVTGAVEAEQFDKGGRGTAYFNSAVNPTNSYRATGMFIEPCTDLGGGYALSRLKKDDWVRYTFVVQVAGYYTFEARVSRASAGAAGARWAFDIAQANGAAHYLAGPLEIENDAWHNVAYPGVYLEAGTNAFTLVMLQESSDGYVGRFNHLAIYPTVTANTFPDYTRPVTGLVAGEPGTSLQVAQANSLAVQTAVDDVLIRGGGTVLIPAGTYYLAQSERTSSNYWEYPNGNGGMSYAVVVLAQTGEGTFGSNIRIAGDPDGGTVLVSHNRSTTLFWTPNWFGLVQPQSFSNVTFEDLTLKGRPHTRADGTYEPGWLNNGAGYGGTGCLLVAGAGQRALKRLNIRNCSFVNPSVYAVVLTGIEDAVIEGNRFSCFNGEIPDGEPLKAELLLDDGVTGIYLVGGVGIVGTGTGNSNVVVINNLYDGHVGLTPEETNLLAEGVSADGLVWLQRGGNWFVGRNSILNYGLEGVQFNAGPGAVVGNYFKTTQRSGSTCALSVAGDWPTLSGTLLDRTYTFMGNYVEGGRSAVLSAYDDYAGDTEIHFSIHFCGNDVTLYPPVNPWTDRAPVALNLMRCDRANIAGNALRAADFALRCRYGDISAEIRNNNFLAVAVAPLDYQGSQDALERVVATQNWLGSGWGEHLRLNWVDAAKFFFVRNSCFGPAGAPSGLVTDPWGAPVHASQ